MISKNRFVITTALWLLVASSSVFAQSYRLLITNDDGIESPLLAALKQSLEALPDVEIVVAAPHENQSGSANSTVGSPLVVDKVFKNGELFGYAVHGRPADAVTFAVNQLSQDRPFDLVVSGINRGANVGNVSHGSGTVGAAMRAQMLGIPAIAVSQGTADVNTDASAQFAARVVEKIRLEGAPEGIVLSINIPDGELQGVQVRPMGESYLARGTYEVVSVDGNTTTYAADYIIQQATDSDNDTYSYQQGYITITPLKFDWTAYEFMSELESWNLH